MSSILPSIEPFWSDPAVQPSSDFWYSWKTTLLDYVSVLAVVNQKQELNEETKLRILRLHLGTEGKRVFDALNLSVKATLNDALVLLEKLWGSRVNAYAARYKFSQLRQSAGSDRYSLSVLLTRIITLSVRCAVYSSISQDSSDCSSHVLYFVYGVTVAS